MIGSLKRRLAQFEQQKLSAQQQAEQQADRARQLREHATLVKDLLRDPRYETYTTLLREAQASLGVEREGLLREQHDRDVRDHRVSVLTGRIQQLEIILHAPDQLLASVEEDEMPRESRPDGVAPPAARSPAA